MVQVIYDFLITFIGDVAFTAEEGSLTLMNLISYILTLGIFSFILLTIISLFKAKKKEGR